MPLRIGIAMAIGAGGGPSGPVKVFEFDGATQEAVLATGWKPKGLPFDIEMMTNRTSFGLNDRFISGGERGYTPSTSANVSFRAYFDGALNNTTVVAGGSRDYSGETLPIALRCKPKDSKTDFDGQQVGNTKTYDIDLNLPWDKIAGNLGNNWHGKMWDLRFVDGSPIHGSDVVKSDGVSRLVNLASDIVLGGEFEIEFSWARQDRSGTGNQYVLGSSPTNGGVQIQDTGAAAPNRISVRADSGTSRHFDLALEDVVVGTYCRVKIVRNSSDILNCWVDGEDKGNANASLVGNVTLNQLAGIGTTAMSTDAILQDVKITNVDTGDVWQYDLNEGSGTDAIDTGNTAGNDGVWTSVSWESIPSNTIIFPMTEGSGSTFKAYDDKGNRRSEYDALIANYTDNWGPQPQ